MRLSDTVDDVALTVEVLLDVVRGSEGAGGLDGGEDEVEVLLSALKDKLRVL